MQERFCFKTVLQACEAKVEKYFIGVAPGLRKLVLQSKWRKSTTNQWRVAHCCRNRFQGTSHMSAFRFDDDVRLEKPLLKPKTMLSLRHVLALAILELSCRRLLEKTPSAPCLLEQLQLTWASRRAVCSTNNSRCKEVGSLVSSDCYHVRSPRRSGQ